MHKRIDFARGVRHLLGNGHTTASIAREIGCTQPTVSRLANGHISSLSVEPALQLLELAGGSVVVPQAFAADPSAPTPAATAAPAHQGNQAEETRDVA